MGGLERTDDQDSPDHRRHRPGWRLPRRVATDKGYIVHGIKRRASLFNTDRVDHLYLDPHEHDVRFFMHYGDMTDATNLIRVIQETQPDEIYNLAAQSHVQVSFETPEYTANADALGTLRLLEAMRILGLERPLPLLPGLDVRDVRPGAGDPAEGDHAFYPRSPYGAAKCTATGSPSTTARPTGCTRATASSSTTRAPPRRDIRHAQDHPRRRAHRSGAQNACTSETSIRSATGATPATTSRP